MAAVNEYWRTDSACTSSKEEGAIPGEAVCDFSGGDPKAEAVYVIGDSHAQHWQGGLLEVAKKKKWKLYYAYYGGCAIADVPYIGYTKIEADGGAACRAKAADAYKRILALKPQRVLYSIYARAEKVEVPAGKTSLDVWKQGLRTYWEGWADAGIQVDVLADPPLNGEVRSTSCLGLNAQNPEACAVERAKALGVDPQREAMKGLDNSRIRLIDTTDAFCDSERCYAAAGGVAVYYNQDHLNREYARLMWPYLARLITGSE